jgi:CBS domain-containing protein
MTAQTVMNSKPVTLALHDSFGQAFHLLLDMRVRGLPVVDPEGHYRGMFDLYDIWSLLLPKGAQLDRDSIEDLGFVSSTAESLQERLQEAWDRPIADFLDDDHSPAITPEAPVIEAVLQLNRHGGNLPVVDEKSGKLLGIMSPWEILAQVRG